jgi:hypothetical protein
MGQHPETNEGRRMAEAHNTARRNGGELRWIAVRLSDGGSDGVIYDRRADAVRHQIHETQCAYVMVQPADMTPAEATALIRMHRDAYAAGYRMTDPHESPFMPSRAPMPVPPVARTFAPPFKIK